MDQVFIGFTSVGPVHFALYAIAGILIFLAIKKQYEPVLLLPIGFGMIIANLPLAVSIMHDGQPGFLTSLYDFGIAGDLFPLLIFVGIGAMIDFSPLFKNPVMIFFGAAAQLGIFATMLIAVLLGFDLKTASAIGIIGAADGPTAIYVGSKFAKDLMGPITVVAYSYMSLVPVIQPPVIKLLTTKNERRIKMKVHEERAPKLLLICFPIIVTFVSGFVAPISVPLVGTLMFGNLLREAGVVDKLSKAAQNELTNLITLLLGLTIGSTMRASQLSDPAFLLATVKILLLGIVAFVFDTAGGVLFAKFLNLFRKEKINPMIGACGISAFPMSARVIQKMAAEEEKGNIILMQAVSANVSGQLGSIVAGGLVLALIPLFV